LLEGQYDEGESHTGFLEALNAWRGVAKPDGDTKKSVDTKGEKKVRFNDDPTAAGATSTSPAKKTNFFANLGGESEWNADCLPSFEEKEIKPDPSLEDKKYSTKESCWNCYKLFASSAAVVDQDTKRVFFDL
jgi:hypothetical protein